MFGRARLIATFAIGLGLACLPLVGANLALQEYAHSRGESNLKAIGIMTIRHVEDKLDQAIEAIRFLDRQGIDHCNSNTVRIMQRQVFSNIPVKVLGLMDHVGQVICTQTGQPLALDNLSMSSIPMEDGISFRLVSAFEDNQLALLVAHPTQNFLSYVALIPQEAFELPSLLKNRAGLSGAVVSQSLQNGQFVNIAEFSFDKFKSGSGTGSGKDLSYSLSSERYPINVDVRASFAANWNVYIDLQAYVNLGSVLVGILLFFFFVQTIRRSDAPVNDIEDGIAKGEFVPFYQPIINIQTGQLAGCEVLIRRRRPDGSIELPGGFIGLAEATGLATPMTTMLMRKVAEDLGAIYLQRPGLKVGINLFNDHFDSLEIIKDIETIFGQSGVHYSQLVFEVTERQQLKNINRAKVVIRKMQALGARVALDDAGTGHGGLAYLQQLGMDIIKIDKIFVDSIGTDRFSLPIIGSLVKLAEDLGMSVVAEGVETLEQVDYLKKLNIEDAQGFLFAPALPAASYIQMCEAMVPSIARENKSGPSNSNLDARQYVGNGRSLENLIEKPESRLSA